MAGKTGESVDLERPQLTPGVQLELNAAFYRSVRWMSPAASFVALLVAIPYLRPILSTEKLAGWALAGLAVAVIRIVGNYQTGLLRWTDRRGTPYWTNASSGAGGLHFGLVLWLDIGAFGEGDNWVRAIALLLAVTLGGVVGLPGVSGNSRYSLVAIWVPALAAVIAMGHYLPAAGLFFLIILVARDLSTTASIMMETVWLREKSRQQAADARHQALHDPLTGLLNRAGLDDVAGTLSPDVAVTAMYVDLDRFKAVNDSYGHPTGDRLLTEVAQRLLRQVRPIDSVARLGGDEFMVLVTGELDEAASTRLAQSIIADLERPIEIDEVELSISASIGITVAHGLDFDLARVQAEADKALYVAKDNGRRQASRFDQLTS